MHSITHSAPTSTTSGSFGFRPLAWIVRLDAAWREYRRFKALDAKELADMGLTKADRDNAFFRQFADRGLR